MSAPKFVRWKTAAARLSPAWVAFLGSMLLSLIAVQRGTINRDGMLYVDTARVFLEEGLAAAFQAYSWPFMSVLMAWVSQAGGLDMEAAGYLICSLFMAGTCALLVACAKHMFPEAVWHVVLVVLAMPGLNSYRNELLREYGGWFFCMLAIWLALRWTDMPRWSQALAIQASLSIAALFRPEALALFPALVFWQLCSVRDNHYWQRTVMIGSLPVLMLAVLLGLLLSNQLDFSRLAGDFHRFAFPQFRESVRAMANVMPDYAQGQASLILFFGSLAIVPVKLVSKMGFFVVPLGYLFADYPVRQIFARWGIFFWMFLAHYLILSVFVLEMQFLAGRYLGLMLLLVVPFVGYGLMKVLHRLPAWKAPFMMGALLLIVSNAVSLSSTKHHFVDAGRWLAENSNGRHRVYMGSPRTAYYAGWRYVKLHGTRPSHEKIAQMLKHLKNGEYNMIVLEVSGKEPNPDDLLREKGFSEIKHFSNGHGDSVIIAICANCEETRSTR